MLAAATEEKRQGPRVNPSAMTLRLPRLICVTTLSKSEAYLPLGTNMEVVVGSKLQHFCLLRDNFICDLLHQRQNTLHTVTKAQCHLIILVLFFQELQHQTLLLPPVCQQRRHTSNVTLATPKTAFATGFN